MEIADPQTPEMPKGWGPLHDPRLWLIARIAAMGCVLAAAVAGLVDAATAGVDVDLSLRQTTNNILQSQRFAQAVLSIGLASLLPALWRGKRWATAAAIVLSCGVIASMAPASRPLAIAATIALLVITLVGWRAFSTKSDPFALVNIGKRFAVAQGAILAYGIAGLNLLGEHFVEPSALVGAIVDGFRLLFLLPASSALARTGHGAHFIESVRLLSLANVAFTVVVLFVPLIRKPATIAQREVATRIVNKFGANRLAHFALWDDKEYAIAEDEDGLVSYKVKGRVALALGGPIGSEGGRQTALEEFVAKCNDHGWLPALHQVAESDRDLLEKAGFRLQHVGAEAIVDVQKFSLEGSHWKKVRSSLSMLKRDGLAVEELAHPIDDDTMAELEAVSDDWRTSGGHRERTFTLGQFSPAYLQATRVFVVRGGDSGRIEAFVNVVPRYQSIEGTFDLMRRRPDSANGVMDALFIAMIETFKAEGLTGMNLGMAPLAQLPHDAALDKGLHQLREHGDQWFNFEGLEKFKQKWEPNWENRYVAYRNNAELPAVLLCVQSIGEIPEAKGARGVLHSVATVARKLPATLTLGGLILWLMAATAIDPDLHDEVLSGFGISWPDLFDLDVWRAAASPLVQAEPGFVVTNLLMVLTVLPLVEWRLGSRRALLTYWIGSLATTLPVLGFLRLLGELGDLDALDFVYSRDAGSSAGLWALAGTALALLPKRRLQLVALGAVLVVHLTLALATKEVSNTQHLVATLVGYALAFVTVEGSARARSWQWIRTRTGLGATAGPAESPIG